MYLPHDSQSHMHIVYSSPAVVQIGILYQQEIPLLVCKVDVIGIITSAGLSAKIYPFVPVNSVFGGIEYKVTSVFASAV